MSSEYEGYLTCGMLCHCKPFTYRVHNVFLDFAFSCSILSSYPRLVFAAILPVCIILVTQLVQWRKLPRDLF
jgi:hypothetical protein